MSVDTAPEFTCEACGETFVSAWTEEENLAEMRRVFGDLSPEDRCQVCDECYRELQRCGTIPTVRVQ